MWQSHWHGGIARLANPQAAGPVASKRRRLLGSVAVHTTSPPSMRRCGSPSEPVPQRCLLGSTAVCEAQEAPAAMGSRPGSAPSLVPSGSPPHSSPVPPQRISTSAVMHRTHVGGTPTASGRTEGGALVHSGWERRGWGARMQLEGEEVTPPPLQGAQPLPSHCLPDCNGQLQWHL